jgi:hypothetical protein
VTARGSAFALAERFGEVFSKLRAGYVALGGGADAAPFPTAVRGVVPTVVLLL